MNLNKYLYLFSIVTLTLLTISCDKNDDDDQNNTPVNNDPNYITDVRDGIKYSIVNIGSQVWTAENIKYKASSGCWAYKDEELNADTFGRLYSWAVALTVCPDGWHLPTDEDWKTLEMYLGMSRADADNNGYRGTTEGGKLKGSGTFFWKAPNTDATNEVSFNGLPGGYRAGGYYFEMGDAGSFWTASEHSGSRVWNRGLSAYSATIGRHDTNKEEGLSVRCVKDQ